MQSTFKKLRISETATDQEIQETLHQLFKTSPQGIQHSQGPQGHSVLLNQSPQGSILSTNEDTGPQGIELRPPVVAATAISEIKLDNAFKNSLHSFL